MSGVHHWIGFFCMFGMLLQPFIGVLADKLFSIERGGNPYVDYAHTIIGYTVWIAAHVNMYLGINMPDSDIYKSTSQDW